MLSFFCFAHENEKILPRFECDSILTIENSFLNNSLEKLI